MNQTPPLDKDAMRIRVEEQAREGMRHALEAVVSGADFADADAVIDHLDDLGYRIAPIEGRR